MNEKSFSSVKHSHIDQIAKSNVYFQVMLLVVGSNEQAKFFDRLFRKISIICRPRLIMRNIVVQNNSFNPEPINF